MSENILNQIQNIKIQQETINIQQENLEELENRKHYEMLKKYELKFRLENNKTSLNHCLPITIKINKFLNKYGKSKSYQHNWLKYSINLSLFYHIFVYLYLGITKGGGALYTGIMYSIMYCGALLAYWIIYRQNNPLITWANIISSELVTDIDERTRLRKCNEHQIDNIFHTLQSNFKKNNYQTNGKLTQFEFMDENIKYLLTNQSAIESFYFYCKKWEMTGNNIYIIWCGIALIVMILKVIPDDIVFLGKSFDEEPIALWGYYNLIGQFVASIGIVNASIIMLTGFYQMQCMMLNFASRIREWRKKEISQLEYTNEETNQQLVLSDSEKSEIIERKKQNMILKNFTKTRDEYLFLQQCCVTLSDIWSAPVVAIIFFCTAVVITNLFVINYELTKCESYNNDESVINDYCDYFIGYSFIWMTSALAFAGVLLYSVSSINTAAVKIKKAFIFSNNGLSNLSGEKQLVKPEYHAIGGRDNWLNYIDSNPIRFTIYGITVTSTYAVNTSYAVCSSLGTFLISYLFTDNSD